MPRRRFARHLPSALALTAFLAAPLGLVPPGLVPIGTAYAQDDGARLFRRCTSCHTTEQGGANKAGPNLWGVVGATSAARDTGFNYSPALREAALEWNDETLDQWLADPRAFVPGSRMPIGIARPEQRQALIAYLKEVTR